MQTYEAMRHFADSGGLVALFLFFAGACVWAFRPGARALHDDAAQVPFRNDDQPGE